MYLYFLKNKTNYFMKPEVKQWWDLLSSASKTRLCDLNTEYIGIKRWETLTDFEITHIYQQETTPHLEDYGIFDEQEHKEEVPMKEYVRQYSKANGLFPVYCAQPVTMLSFANAGAEWQRSKDNELINELRDSLSNAVLQHQYDRWNSESYGKFHTTIEKANKHLNG